MTTPSPEFPFASKYIEVHGSNIHYIEQGEGTPILFLHGNPTSSYLWRNIIPHVSGQGRAIAMDLIGMGKSDKPEIEYRFVDHYQYVTGFIEALGLKDIVLVIHDWGSALGFHYAMSHEDNVRAIAFMEAIIAPLPSLEAMPASAQELFKSFRTKNLGWDLIVNQNVFIERLLPGSVVRPLTEQEMQVYRAPYPEPTTRKPLWRWPNEIPIAGEPADVTAIVAAYNAKLQKSQLPKLLLHSTPGALTPPPMVEWCKANLPNLRDQHVGAGIHFIQEDTPDEIGNAISTWLHGLGTAKTPDPAPETTQGKSAHRPSQATAAARVSDDVLLANAKEYIAQANVASIDGMMALFAPDAIGNGQTEIGREPIETKGIDALREAYSAFFATIENGYWDVAPESYRISRPNVVEFDIVVTGKILDHTFHTKELSEAGKKVHVHAHEQIRFNDAGQIVYISGYFTSPLKVLD